MNYSLLWIELPLRWSLILLITVGLVNPIYTHAQIINTVAGRSPGRYYSGDGGPATSASLNIPSKTVIDRLGNLYIVDVHNNRIRKVNPAGIITTVAGMGTQAYLGDGGPPPQPT